VLLVVLTFWVLEPKVELAETAEIFMVGFYFGFLTVGLQSIIYSLLMEFYVRKRITNDWAAIRMSVLLGLLAGSPLALIELPWIVPYGAFIGAVVGWMLRKMETRRQGDTAVTV